MTEIRHKNSKNTYTLSVINYIKMLHELGVTQCSWHLWWPASSVQYIKAQLHMWHTDKNIYIPSCQPPSAKDQQKALLLLQAPTAVQQNSTCHMLPNCGHWVSSVMLYTYTITHTLPSLPFHWLPSPRDRSANNSGHSTQLLILPHHN